MTANPPARAPALRVDGLAKTFGEGGEAVRAVDGVSLSVDHGEVLGVLGPNGAGKTTAIKSMLGLVLPDAGTVEICGVDVHDEPAIAYRHVDAMLEGARNVYWRLTVRENLRYFAGLGGVDPGRLTERHDRLLESLDLADVADTVVNELSRGMKQKVSLATTLARDVDVVFLDEPTLGLDVESSIELRSELRRLADGENVTIVLCSHDMAVIEAVCDRIAILQDGRVIADDSMSELVNVLREKRFSVTTAGPIDDELAVTLRERFDATIREPAAQRGDEQGNERDPGDGSAPERMSGDESATEHEAEGNAVTIDATGIDAEAAAGLLDALRSAGRPLLDVETAEPTLEDVFLRLTETGPGGGSEPTAASVGEQPDDSAAGDTEVIADGER
ncbi:ABC transporter ATP-binding protein [Salinarchaeum laminariae]|uniref:ABC transporter ATP-binding protein n=1 Tax=Salinarchaeum laminariae TaxID=869888 RepID=UPI0020C0B9B2|nr:ABC transporter ATP-binding protein [Salinarchaeum laminariae]